MFTFKSSATGSRSEVRWQRGLISFALAASFVASAADMHDQQAFWPGNLVVSRSVYDNNPNNIKVGTVLPPNCGDTTGGCPAPSGAPYNGTTHTSGTTTSTTAASVSRPRFSWTR